MKNKPARPRRSQADRRRATKAAIMDASLKVLIESGYAGFSASGVAARAGVSRGAQEHYYPKKNDLIAAATDFAMQQAIDHARKSASAASSAVNPIDRFMASSEDFFFMPVFMAMTEILIAARSDRDLAHIVYPIIKDARRVLDEIWTDTLVEAGHSRERARQFIELTHYVLRGLFYVSSWTPYEVSREEVIRTWRKLAPAVLSLDLEQPEEGNDARDRLSVASA